MLTEIIVGKTYRVILRQGSLGKTVRDRTVVSYDPDGPLPGGVVKTHTGLTRSGKQSQTERRAGDYFRKNHKEIEQ